MLCMADMPAGWEQWVWRSLGWSLTHTSQSLAHGGGTDLPPRARKCLELELPLISTNLWTPLLPLLAATVYHPPTPAAFPCSRRVGFNSTVLLPLMDVGLLELTKPHL